MALILVVDDEEVLLRGLSRYLKTLGHDVRTASSGRAAMLALETTAFDLLVTDINMPETDGLEILNALRIRDSAPPVIAMSGGGLFDKGLLLGSAGMLGATALLEKPFELRELGAAVERLLA